MPAIRILVTCANGKTGRHIIDALHAHATPTTVRGFVRRRCEISGVEQCLGDLTNPGDRIRSVTGMDAVIHYGPPLDPDEAAMGIGMIDAAIAAGVARFVYVSVIHPQIDDLINHKAKLDVEAHLLDTALYWTILRPQHYMQNTDISRAVASGLVAMPYPPSTRLGHVDMIDLAEVAAKVLLEPGHSFATYDICAGQELSVDEICAVIARLSGKAVAATAITVEQLIDMIRAHRALPIQTEEAIHRLFGYYARRGIRGNANVLGWLLGRAPNRFDAYVRRCLP